jgi:hypothetical protein
MRSAIRLLIFVVGPAALGQQISVSVTPHSPLVAELARLEVAVTASKAVPVEMPDGVRLGCGVVTQAFDDKPRAASGGRIRYRRSFLLELNGPGPCRVPPLPILYGEAQLATEEITFEVRSAISPDEGPDPDIRDQLPIVPFRKSSAGAWPIIAIVALGLLSICGVIWFLRRNRKLPKESAEALARRRLAELGSTALPPRREFCEALIGTLMQYAQQRFGLRADRCTSAELIGALRRMDVVTPECELALYGLLEDCDRGRYAGAYDTEGDPASAIALCRDIVDSLGAQAASQPRMAGKLTLSTNQLTQSTIVAEERQNASI